MFSKSQRNLPPPASSAQDDVLSIRKAQQIERVLGKSASEPNVGVGKDGFLTVAHRRQIVSHLPAPKRKTRPRKVFGAGALPPPQLPWNCRHQFAAVENELKPKQMRSYFSRPQNEDELREDIGKRGSMTSMMWISMDKEDGPITRPTPISSDAEPPVIPSRHVIGGSMRNEEREIIPWNNRSNVGMGGMNDGMHPLHREYFSEPSLFATAPSQRWRRMAEVEIGCGMWKPIISSPSMRVYG